MCKIYKLYSTEEKIAQCKHKFDTQINEDMNTCVSKYAPKIKHYSKYKYLEARVKTVAGLYNCGCHSFWTDFMKVLDVDIDIYLESRLLERNKIKLKKVLVSMIMHIWQRGRTTIMPRLEQSWRKGSRILKKNGIWLIDRL